MEYPKIDALNQLIARLRGKKGCPWDRKQTPQTMALYLREEVYELADAIETGDPSLICEELGDVLFQLLFIAKLFEEKGLFDIETAAGKIEEKMIRRHPHVFGDSRVENAEDVRNRWQQIKKEEKNNLSAKSILDSVPPKLPALMRAYRISERAARTGFDWDNIAGVMEKTEEEWKEFREELGKNGDTGPDSEQNKKTALEFGDILFTLVNVARFARIHPETALAGATRKFEQRFKYMEAKAAEKGISIDDVPRPEKERLWDAAKNTASES
ncbi:MAG: nucleoside triphosphate pyrophosphohydrolase [Desulfococcaceae bacterium]|nr:nucleoside triphosphate pyrophosphohydrolase [Desulfococcaceae bacterium]